MVQRLVKHYKISELKTLMKNPNHETVGDLVNAEIADREAQARKVLKTTPTLEL